MGQVKDTVLVSVASNGRENYNKAQLSMIDSAITCSNFQQHWYGDYLLYSVDGYCPEYKNVKINLGSWPKTERYGISWQHADNPYQFKPYAIQAALELGYKKILWCDSTIRILQNPDLLWVKAAQNGILAWNNEGHPLAPWVKDDAVKELGISYSELPKVKQIMACCIMFDFNNTITQAVFNEWIEASNNNLFMDGSSFRGDFRGHRHDQAILSALLYKHKVDIEPYGDLAYRHYQPVKPTFINWGVE